MGFISTTPDQCLRPSRLPATIYEICIFGQNFRILGSNSDEICIFGQSFRILGSNSDP